MLPRVEFFVFACAVVRAQQRVAQFAPIDLQVTLPVVPTNPFDVKSLGTYVTFTDAAGTQSSVYPFLTQSYTRSQAANGSEILMPTSAPFFAVRFAPTVVGAYTYQQYLSVQNASVTPTNGSFLCVLGAADGFARVDARFKRYFTRSDNTSVPFWLVGENMAWPGVWPYFANSSLYSNGSGGTFMYDRYMTKLAAVGGNWIRLWIGPSLVTEPVWDGEQGSLLDLALMSLVPFGSYNLQSAWRIDYVVELARRLGVKITLVIDAQQACCEPGTWCFWNLSAYNAVNGGPLSDPADMWTNAATLSELTARWRYVLARWSYSTSIFSWELANENDDWAGWGPAAVAVQQQMAAMLTAEDPRQHMVDDSFGNPNEAVPDLEGSPLIAFTTAHAYDAPDEAAMVWSYIPSRVVAWGKPSFIEEFGASWRGPLQHELDPTGIGLHNAAWASLAGGAAGTGMQWWWNEVDALGVYDRLAGAAAFAKQVAAPLLLTLHWTTWDPNTAACAGGNAGWIIGMQPETATARAVIFWVYNRNHTWANMNANATLAPIAGCTYALHNVPLASSANMTVQWYNTTTGQVLPQVPQRHERVLRSAEGTGDVTLAAPTFLTDVAALALLSSKG